MSIAISIVVGIAVMVAAVVPCHYMGKFICYFVFCEPPPFPLSAVFGAASLALAGLFVMMAALIGSGILQLFGHPLITFEDKE